MVQEIEENEINVGKREKEVTSKGGGKKEKGAETTTRSKTNLASKKAFFKSRFKVLSECRISGQAKLTDKPTNLMFKHVTKVGISI
jgi:hypothetical protein